MQPKSNLLDEQVTLKMLRNDSMSLVNDPTKGSSIHVEDFLSLIIEQVQTMDIIKILHFSNGPS
jgi:hypothetical protein